MKARVVCPVCHAGLDFEVPDDSQLWGVIPVMDVGCMEVTMPYNKDVSDHIDAHRNDGSHWEAVRKYYESMATGYANLAKRFGWDASA